ncbi:MAG: sensor histidine kinase [Gammaproteobacteria bacterium]|nr:MAG: sensor histidine kinase [Gammaproteobacteria bacterium]
MTQASADTSTSHPENPTPSGGLEQIQRLLNLYRWSFIALEIIMLFLASQVFSLSLPIIPLTGLIVLHTLISLVAFVIGRSHRYSTHHRVVWLFLILDTLVLSGFLYLTGGSTNPLVSLLLLPLVMVASLLPIRFVYSMALLTTLSYTLLIFSYHPLEHPATDFRLHVIGMWIGFLFSVTLVVLLVARLAHQLRQHEKALNQAREQALHDEYLVSLGTLAAGAAHELGTPLSSISVIVNELQTEPGDADHVRSSLQLIEQQLQRCKRIISNISEKSGQRRFESGHAQPLNEYLHRTVQQWRASHPDITDKQITTQWDGPVPGPLIFTDQNLTQSITNLLTNASEASNKIDVMANWDPETLHLIIQDHGEGIHTPLLEKLGTPFVSTKPDGQGLGFFLVKSVIERLGGMIEVISHRQDKNIHGTRVTLKLPLQKLLCHAH